MFSQATSSYYWHLFAATILVEWKLCWLYTTYFSNFKFWDFANNMKVLAPGGSKEPIEVLSDFLGREPSIQAFVDARAECSLWFSEATLQLSSSTFPSPQNELHSAFCNYGYGQSGSTLLVCNPTPEIFLFNSWFQILHFLIRQWQQLAMTSSKLGCLLALQFWCIT